MGRWQIDVRFLPPFGRVLSHPWLRQVAQEALALGGRKEGCQVSITLADDATVKGLNRAYRGLDESTDVLAFAFGHPGQWEGEARPPAPSQQACFVAEPGGPEMLGEVVVSYPQAVRQAQKRGIPVEREAALLVVHGVLHLLGYDHHRPDEGKRMRALERQTLARLFARG